MCYDISFSTQYELVSQYVPDLQVDPQITFDYESSVHIIAQAYLKKPIIYKENGAYYLKEFEWGLIAPYMNTPESIKKNRQWMCNAQSEKILDKKSFWNRIRQRRCLIPVTGFFEHREVKGMKSKVPYFIRLKDREVFCLAGLYNYAPLPDMDTGELRGTFTVVTRRANTLMQHIHNGGANAGRMPLLLPKNLEMQWLDETLSDEELGILLNYSMPEDGMEAHPVYTIRTTKPRPDGKGKLDPFEWPGLPPLGSDTSATQLF